MAEQKQLRALIGQLQANEIFGLLPAVIVKHLAGHMQAMPLTPGQQLVAEGEYDPRLYFIASGTISAYKKDNQGNRVLLRVLGSGELMGLASAFHCGPKGHSARSASLVAEEASLVWSLEHSFIENLMNGQDLGSEHALAFNQALLSYFCRKVRKKNFQIVTMKSGQNLETTSKKVKIAFFDSKDYTQEIFLRYHQQHLGERYQLTFFSARLNEQTVSLAANFPVICPFVNDILSAPVVAQLHAQGTALIVLRCAGFNNVDLAACQKYGISVARVPAYSPYAVAEHSLALLMALNRKIHHAYNRVREGNFSLSGLVGQDLFGKTIGILGTGKIGKCMANIAKGLGMQVLAFDLYPDLAFASSAQITYSSLEQIWQKCDVISLHIPLVPATKHLINATTMAQMKKGVIIINTGRGALVDTKALIAALKSGQVGAAGLDVYEEEQNYFFEDFSGKIIDDDILARLMTFNNVLITSHQAFLTNEALENITATTFENVGEFLSGKSGAQLTNGVFLQT